MGFTLDEFALWLHLRDVYWSEEGRSSFDAVVVALSFAALVVVGSRPFGLDDPASVWTRWPPWPSSMWARRFYDDIKLDRAARRYAPTGRLSRLGARLSELVAGAPTDEECK